MLDDLLSRRILIQASVCGALAIAIGAFGTHYLPIFLETQGLNPDLITKRVGQFDIGARYHLIHAVALLALSGNPYGKPTSRHWVARLFLLGTIIFSGSLYLLAVSNITLFGMITPLGGVTWIGAWLTLLWTAGVGGKKQKKFAQIHGKQL